MARNSKGIETAEIIPDKCIACQICIGECPVGAVEFEKKRRKKLSPVARGGTAVQGVSSEGVAVFIEISEGFAANVSWELVGKAGDLARKRDTRVIGFLLGHRVESIAREAVSYGCNEVHLVDHPDLETYLSGTYGKILADLCREIRPEILLIGATHLGRDLAGVVATRLGTGLTADCTGLDIEEETGLMLMTRPTFGGNIMATIFCENRRPQMSSVRPRVMKIPEKNESLEGTMIRHTPGFTSTPMAKVISFKPAAGSSEGIEISEYPVLIAAGKGACAPAAFPILQKLADTLGGALVCTRPLVEAGLMPYERQVGQTGKTVAPRLYIAVGVSGAVQHLVGIQGAEKIVAINKDRYAPIFQVVDVGIVGDYTKVIPVLAEQLKARMGSMEQVF